MELAHMVGVSPLVTRTLVLSAALALASCSQLSPGSGGNPDKADNCGEEQAIILKLDFGLRAFTSPVAAVPHPSDADRWYIVEQRGIIWTMVRAEGVVTPRRFADLRSRVNDEPGEGGLFSIALHPNFDQNGQVFVSYTAASAASPANLQSRVSRFVSEDGGLTLNRDTEEVLLAEEQPFENHNGGQIAFGPDGLLYIGMGDGGSAGDPLGKGQNTGDRLGKILRIDVDNGTPFGIPADNPFASGGGGLPEIYATGIRNPWRFSFDSQSGELYVADVGQALQEEVNIVVNGGNYGWNVREGDNCFESSVCSEDFENPIATYGRDEGISITGGYVYHGLNMPELAGSYIFGDFGSGKIWALKKNVAGEMERTLLLESGLTISGFAQDNDGELFVIDYASGNIIAITPGGVVDCPSADSLTETAPPFDPNGILTFDELYNQVISVSCAPCHTTRALGGLRMPNPDVAFESLINVAAESDDCLGRTRVIANDPDNSLLFSKVSGVNLCGPMMPTSGTISGEAIEEMRKWIEAGALR